MKAEWIIVTLTGVGQFAAIVVFSWRSGRIGGEVVTEVRHLATAMQSQAEATDRLAATVATESKSNAVQDARLNEHGRRLDDHDRRLDDHDKEIDQLWGRP